MIAGIFDPLFLDGEVSIWVQMFWFVLAIAFTFSSFKVAKTLPNWVESYWILMDQVLGQINEDTGAVDKDTKLDIEKQQSKDRTGTTARRRQRLLIFCVSAATLSWCCWLFST